MAADPALRAPGRRSACSCTTSSERPSRASWPSGRRTPTPPCTPPSGTTSCSGWSTRPSPTPTGPPRRSCCCTAAARWPPRRPPCAAAASCRSSPPVPTSARRCWPSSPPARGRRRPTSPGAGSRSSRAACTACGRRTACSASPCRSTSRSAATLAVDDPVAAAVLRAVEQHGALRPGERVHVNRFAGAAGRYQGDPLQLLVNGVACILEWSSRPAAWTFIVPFASDLYGPLLRVPRHVTDRPRGGRRPRARRLRLGPAPVPHPGLLRDGRPPRAHR